MQIIGMTVLSLLAAPRFAAAFSSAAKFGVRVSIW